ncbi:hypothetical protein LTR53_014012 [Teratosphaeriaceae sp. CCFEE 6253]|nr:hypothetical protein LTR53_014012 [Teratosphaeriaceae sp. CCFEE 6253]
MSSTTYKKCMQENKPFRFLELPTELQQRIFLMAMGEYVEPRYLTKARLIPNTSAYENITNLTGHGQPAEIKESYRCVALHKRLAPVNLALLGLNKALRAPALEVLWTQTTKRYMSVSGFVTMPTQIPAEHFADMVRLELALTHREYLELKFLKYLELFFMSTIEAAYSPWQCYKPAKGSNPDITAGIDFDRLPCQNTLVDWIVVFAAGYLRDLTHVKVFELSGFIKTETKEKWERILNSKRQADHTAYIGSERQAIEELPNSAFPSSCFCPHPCSLTAIALEELFDAVHWRGEEPPSTKPHMYEKAAREYTFDHDESHGPEEVGSRCLEEEDQQDDDVEQNHSDEMGRDEWMRVKSHRGPW